MGEPGWYVTVVDDVPVPSRRQRLVLAWWALARRAAPWWYRYLCRRTERRYAIR